MVTVIGLHANEQFKLIEMMMCAHVVFHLHFGVKSIKTHITPFSSKRNEGNTFIYALGAMFVHLILYFS